MKRKILSVMILVSEARTGNQVFVAIHRKGRIEANFYYPRPALAKKVAKVVEAKVRAGEFTSNLLGDGWSAYRVDKHGRMEL